MSYIIWKLCQLVICANLHLLWILFPDYIVAFLAENAFSLVVAYIKWKVQLLVMMCDVLRQDIVVVYLLFNISVEPLKLATSLWMIWSWIVQLYTQV